MGDLGAIDEDVVFDHDAADGLALWLGYLADCLDGQATDDRGRARASAREAWEGRYAEEFDDRVATCTGDAEVMAEAARTAKDDVAELARLAREEQERREAARDWMAEYGSGGEDGWHVMGQQVPGSTAAEEFLTGEDAPELPEELTREVEPPSIEVGEPETASQRDARVIGIYRTYGTGGVSSAAPDDLDGFGVESRRQDDLVSSYNGFVEDHHDDFQAGCGWGYFDCSSLISAVTTWLWLNELDAQWVEEIAEAFREADSGELPDSVIEARLEAAGLDEHRGAVVFDDPVAWGASPTSGFADDPVNTASGNFLETELDLPVSGSAGLLSWSRTYNSASDRVGAFGPGWASWASCRLWAEPDGARWVGPDGQEKAVKRAAAPRTGDSDAESRVRYVRSSGIPGQVVAHGDGLALDGPVAGSRMVFDADGRLISVADGPGTEITCTYDDERLVEMRHDGGRVVSFDWAEFPDAVDGHSRCGASRSGSSRGSRRGPGPQWRIVGLQSSDGRRVVYHYDDRGRLIGAEGGPNGARTYDLDAGGRIAAVVDADGVVEARNHYDDQARVVSQTSPFGRRSRYRYLAGHVTMVDDHDDGPRSTFIHEDDRLVSLVDAHGREFRKEYDLGGNPERTVDRDGAVTEFEWDGQNRLTHRRNPDGSSYGFSYDGAGRPAEITACTGDTVTYRYNDHELIPSEMVDPEGAVTRLEVADGLVHRITDADGVEVRYGYDPHGELISVTDGDGNTTRIERSPAGRVTAVVSPSGHRAEYRYDAVGRPVEMRDPTGALTRIEYTAAGRPAAVTDPLGHRREARYGPHGVAIELIGPDGELTERSFDELGNLVRAVLPDGAKLDYTYDKLSRLTSVTDPAGAVWLNSYDACGRITGSTEPSGIERTVTFDKAGRVIELDEGTARAALAYGRASHLAGPARSATELDDDRDPLGLARPKPGRVPELERDDDSDPLGLARPRPGRVPELERDDDSDPLGLARPKPGRLPELERDDDSDPLGLARPRPDDDETVTGWATARLTYDELGRPVRYQRADDTELVLSYDRCGRRTAMTGSDGAVTQYHYSPAGRLTAVTSPAGRITHYEYDHCGRLDAVVDPAGGRVSYRYDPDGRLAGITNQAGETTEFRYDPAGRLVAWISPRGATTAYEYDPAGNLLSVTDPAGAVSHYLYSPSGDMIEAVDPLGGVTRFEYDTRGRLTTMIDPLGGRLERTYDEAGRLTSRTDQVGRTSHYSYDPAGRLTRQQQPDGAELHLHYDEAGRLRVLGTTDDGELVAYTRDLQARPVAGTDSATGIHVEVEFDEAGRTLAQHRTGYGTGADAELAWRYDPDGLPTALIYPDGTETTSTHDEVGRLVAVRHPALGTIEQDFDAAGRLIRRSSAHGTQRWTYRDGHLSRYETDQGGSLSITDLERDAVGQVTAAATDGRLTTYTYDRAGQLTTVRTPTGTWSFTYDAAGRLVGEARPDHARLEYRYDAAHQLTEIREIGPTRGGDIQVTRFRYDDLGRRRQVIRPGGATTDYSYDHLGRLTGIDGNQLTIDPYGHLAAVDGREVHWDGTDPVAQPRWIDGTAIIGDGSDPWATVDPDGTVTWFTHNWQGTVTAPDPTEGHDPWGASTGDRSELGLGYRGELTVAGHLWLRNRLYDPSTRCFTTTDPVPGHAGSPHAANPYHYAGNNPTDASDPLGLTPLTDQQLNDLLDMRQTGWGERFGGWGRGLWDGGWEWGGGIGSFLWNTGDGIRGAAWGTVTGVWGWATDTWDCMWENPSADTNDLAGIGGPCHPSRTGAEAVQEEGWAVLLPCREDFNNRGGADGWGQLTGCITFEAWLAWVTAGSSRGTGASRIRPQAPHLPRPHPSGRVAQMGMEWLGPNARIIRNAAGDVILLSGDGTRRIRFDINRPYPHSSPHAHVEERIDGRWQRSGPIYPTDAPHE